MMTKSREAGRSKRHTVRVHHEDTACGSGVLPSDSVRVDLPPFGHICGVIDDGADEETAAEVVFGVGTDFELKDDSSKIVGGRVDVP